MSNQPNGYDNNSNPVIYGISDGGATSADSPADDDLGLTSRTVYTPSYPVGSLADLELDKVLHPLIFGSDYGSLNAEHVRIYDEAKAALEQWKQRAVLAKLNKLKVYARQSNRTAGDIIRTIDSLQDNLIQQLTDQQNKEKSE